MTEMLLLSVRSPIPLLLSDAVHLRRDLWSFGAARLAALHLAIPWGKPARDVPLTQACGTDSGLRGEILACRSASAQGPCGGYPREVS